MLAFAKKVQSFASNCEQDVHFCQLMSHQRISVCSNKQAFGALLFYCRCLLVLCESIILALKIDFR